MLWGEFAGLFAPRFHLIAALCGRVARYYSPSSQMGIQLVYRQR